MESVLSRTKRSKLNTKRGSFFITNRGKTLLPIGTAFLLHIAEDLLEVGATITNRGSYCLSRQLLQIGA